MNKLLKYFLLLSTVVLLLFVSFSCHSPTGPNGSTQVDTTSSAFTWKMYTFGGNAGSSSFYDVAILSDSNIWTVGEVYLDSADGNPDPFPYNAAHWDGSKWNLLKIPYYYQGQAFYSPIHSIYAFGPNDIWFGAGNHWDGNQFQTLPLNIDFPSYVNKMWGTSSNNLYIIGNGGLIAHRGKNGYWQKLESGTGLPLLDIYGAHSLLGTYQILVVGSNNYPPGNGIFSIQGNVVTEISSNFDFPGNTIPPESFGVWFVPDWQYYVVGDGIYEKHSLSDSIWKNAGLNITRYGISEIRGNNINDVFAVGSFGEVLHFNGKRWTSYINETGLDDGSYGGLVVKGNLVVATGANNPQAVILIGRR